MIDHRTMLNTTSSNARNHTQWYKLTPLLGTILLLSACNITSPAEVHALDTSRQSANSSADQRMNVDCIKQVNTQQNKLVSPSLSQSLSLANTALHCVGDIQYSPAHPDTTLAMQFTALAFVHFVKAGDMKLASDTLIQFRNTFPQQDLLFNDFTSFVDTATVLIKANDISTFQLTSLNINPALRAEIQRQRQWSLP